MNRIILLLFFYILGMFNLSAQNLKGKVIDATSSNPLVGATISSEGKAISTTDQNGMFSIACPSSEISISFVGYKTISQSIVDCSAELTISLTPSNLLLKEVEITATTIQNKSLIYQPSSIAKLGNAELKRGQGLFLDDAINGNIPGVIMQRRTVSAGQQFNIRGYGNGTRGTNGTSSNFDTQGTKVYLNGIAITDAEGITLLDDIDFGSIGNVEVVKGPAGSLYGLAIAGVVNLKTLSAEPLKSSISQDVLLGSYGLKRYTTRLQIGGEKSSMLVSYGRQQYDGFMRHTASQKDFVNVVGDFQPNQKQTISTYFGYSNSYDQRNGELTVNQYNTLDYSGNPSYVANDAHSNVISFRAGMGHTYKFNQTFSNTTTVFGSGVSNNSSSAGGWTDKLPTNFGLRSTLNTDFQLSEGVALTGLTGIETQRQNAQTIGYAMTDPVSGKNNDPTNFNNTGVYNYIGAQTSNVYAVTKTTSLFSEWTLALPYSVSITAGVGVSNMGIDLNNRLVTASNTTPTNATISKTYDNLVSPHFAINKVFGKQVSTYFSYSKGYKTPVSSYFYIPLTGQLNSDLKPEIGTQYELGTKGSVLNDKLFYQLAYFNAVFTNKMTVVAVPNATNTATSYTYVANGGEQDNWGIEMLAKYTAYQSNSGFIKTISPFANATYSNFTYGNFKFQQLSTDKKSNVETDYTGKQVAGVPTWIYNAGIDAVTNFGLYSNVNFNYRGAAYFVSTNEILPRDHSTSNPNDDAKTKSYSLLNAKLGFQKKIGAFDIDAYFGVNNISSTQYYLMVFSNQLPDTYLPGPKDANYFGGLNVKYSF